MYDLYVSFIVIVVKGLFHSDWLGSSPAASPIGPQLGEGETEQSGNSPLAGFLDPTQAEQSHGTTRLS
jgi:hypothetical protein